MMEPNIKFIVTMINDEFVHDFDHTSMGRFSRYPASSFTTSLVSDYVIL